MAETERKTTRPVIGTGSDEKIIPVIEGGNVLHKYRSVSYVFTLSALTTDEVNNPDTYRTGKLNYVILKSSGKDGNGISSTNALAAEFNEKSPGRFDMFIDNVEIHTILTRDKNSASTQPTKMSFTVFEPYSINGFIEALQTSAQAAGHPTYAKAPFVLKVEFKGYPDDDGMPDPITEPYATRYFPIIFSKVDVSVDEKGTKYDIEAIPVNEVHFGNPSTLKKSIKVKGATVKEILEDLVNSLTEQVKKEADDLKLKASSYDEYKVKFPTWDDKKGWVDTADNQIASAKVTEITEDKNLFKMPDPGEEGSAKYVTPRGVEIYSSPAPVATVTAKSTQRVVPNEPNNPVVQFNENRSVQECMEAIIRDSHYLRERLQKLMGESWNQVVEDNMFDYFLIRLEITQKPQIDQTKNKHYFIYTYVVTPYKILFTKVPGFANQTLDQKTLYKSCIRKYDYIYTGNNLDITNFKLSFNNLFFEAIPLSMANVQSQPGRDAVSKTDVSNYKKEESNLNSADKGLPASGMQSDPALTNTMPRSGGQPQQSPYFAMAQALHQSIINSSSNMITGEIDILGDPVFLVTGGLGNNNPAPSDGNKSLSKDGQAQFTIGDMLININFKNPIDIGPDGFYQFDNKLAPFSGVYQIINCKSIFKDGQFKQNLEITRVPGQAIPVEDPSKTPQSSKTPVTNPANTQKQLPNPDDVSGEDSAPVSAAQAGIRPDTLNLLSQLNRTIPSPGLPGALSNFTSAVGGAGSVINIPAGVNPNLPAVSRMISPLGVQTQPAFGIPLPAKAAVGLQQQVYSPGGFIQQAGMNLLKSFGVSGPAAQLASQYLGQVGRKINSVPVLGSGIGVGASINIVKNNTSPQTTADYNNQQLPETPTATPTLQGISGTALGYLGNNLTAIPGITNNAALNVQAATKGNTADPLAIAAAYGISQAQLAGLSPNITSNLINQLSNITKKVPADTDVNTAVQNGVNFNGLTPKDVAALPPTAPYASAPPPAQDVGFLEKLSAAGGLQSVARAFGVSNIKDVSQSQLPADTAQTISDSSPSVLKDYANKLGFGNVGSVQDAAVLGLKLFAERKSLLGPTGIPGSLEGNFIGVRNQLGPVNVVSDLGKSAPSVFGSKSSGASPLDKIMLR